MTETTTRPEIADEVIDRAEIRDGTVLVAYNRTEAAIAELKARYSGVQFDVTTTAGDKAARAARMELVRLRTGLDAKRKDFKAPALEFGRRIDSEAKRLEGEILALESPIDAQIRAEETRRAAERAERERIEAARVQRHRSRIAEILAAETGHATASAATLTEAITAVVALDVSPAQYEEFSDEAAQAQADTLQALRALHAGAVEREAEALRLAAERAELARMRAEQQAAAAEQARIAREQAAERDRLAVEAQRIAAAEARARQQEADCIAAEQEAQRRHDAAEQVLLARAAQQLAPIAQKVVTTEAQDAAIRAIKTSPELLAMMRQPRPEPATLNLTAINARFKGCIKLDAAGLALMGIEHSATDKSARLYRESDIGRICRALVVLAGEVVEMAEAA